MGKYAVVFSAHNEETVLDKTLKSLKRIVRPQNIYLVSDGSTDKTVDIARVHGINVTSNRKNIGKTRSLKKALEKYRILNRYKFVTFLDADTHLDNDFFKAASGHFKDLDVACVSGQVIAEEKQNPFIAYRSVMYYIWQNIYKSICSAFNAVTIAPGTASIYRTSVFKHLKFDGSIIIEDFDLTFQTHRKKLGKIVYEPDAIAITQDPDNFHDYFRQITRWQMGFFQSAIKHRVPFGMQRFDIAVLILTINDIVHSLFLIAALPALVLFGDYIDRVVLIVMLGFDMWLIVGFALLHDLSLKRRYFLYWPLLWVLQFIGVAAFFKALYLAVFSPFGGKWVSPRRR